MEEVQEEGDDRDYCNLCCKGNSDHSDWRKNNAKVYPDSSPTRTDLKTPTSSDKKLHHLAGGCVKNALEIPKFSMDSMGYLSPSSDSFSPCRGDDVFNVNEFYATEYFRNVENTSKIKSSNDLHRSAFIDSTPMNTPSYSTDISSSTDQQFVELELVGNTAPDDDYNQQSKYVFRSLHSISQNIKKTNDFSSDGGVDFLKALDFENSGLWLPPPSNQDDEDECGFISYDDDDDDDNIEELGLTLSARSSLSHVLSIKENQNGAKNEALKAVLQGHLTALVSQLLKGEGIDIEKSNILKGWPDVVTKVAWQAATFVKPDTSRGGSMDPGDYVKVKCIASGSPNESVFVRGIVCTKNIKHKRMTSKYKNPTLMLIGGALEYEKLPNQLASIDKLLQQEIDYLKIVMSKIEEHHPNVVMVEKSVSLYAQEYLLAKEISLVSNIKRPLLESIARCTGALVAPSVDHISTVQLGYCDFFHVERVLEELESQLNKIPSKTLMFFEGCPRRLGCAIVLKGASHEVLTKIKHVVQYAVFAAYHLLLQTSFLADEGATLPRVAFEPPISLHERSITVNALTATSVSNNYLCSEVKTDFMVNDEGSVYPNPNYEDFELSSEHLRSFHSSNFIDFGGGSSSDICNGNLLSKDNFMELIGRQGGEHEDTDELKESLRDEVCVDILSPNNGHQNILVAFSSHSRNGTVCEKSRLLRIKFYGCFDKPLGRYLQDDLFGQTSLCHTCSWPAESHVRCFTHNQGNLTINVKHLSSFKLPGERDGKIWMWHRCLRCAYVDGVPPTTSRVVMSDAAWGLSFGKFLELSFSNHAAANRVACCGHSLQRDCLRYYGLGSSIAFFHYSPINILSVHLPPSVLEFNGGDQQKSAAEEAASEELTVEAGSLHVGLADDLNIPRQKTTSQIEGLGEDLHKNPLELQDLLENEEHNYNAPARACRLVPEERTSSWDTSSISDEIDSAWSGSDRYMVSGSLSNADEPEAGPGPVGTHTGSMVLKNSVMPPSRVYSFDSAVRVQERMAKGMASTSSAVALSTLKSFHVSRDHEGMIRDPVLCTGRVSRFSFARSSDRCDGGVAVYDDEPTSLISYALSSKEYSDWLAEKPQEIRKDSSTSSLDSVSGDGSKGPHFRMFGDEKLRFSVTIYFAELFESLRKKCCPSKADFLRSLSRCKQWQAEGGKSKVYFARSLDERFIIKRLTKTEMESFDDFSSHYFKYLTESLLSGSPTCLAKVLGIYQVGVKQGKEGKERRMDVMVMENIFYGRRPGRIYDLKGSRRARRERDRRGVERVLLDTNLAETLCTDRLFVESKAKRSLERAVWNDTAFLGGVEVMDYSLLVGVDEGRHQLVVGIIDFLRQYTWDKRVETLVKASGLLGRPRNAPAPTVISPDHYKRRFRKAMTSYFLSVPHPPTTA